MQMICLGAFPHVKVPVCEMYNGFLIPCFKFDSWRDMYVAKPAEGNCTWNPKTCLSNMPQSENDSAAISPGCSDPQCISHWFWGCSSKLLPQFDFFVLVPRVKNSTPRCPNGCPISTPENGCPLGTSYFLRS